MTPLTWVLIFAAFCRRAFSGRAFCGRPGLYGSFGRSVLGRAGGGPSTVLFRFFFVVQICFLLRSVRCRIV